ncbi:phosphoribosylglycinamide formyltransferase, partial [Streptomyces sp. NPDC049597]
MTAHKKADLVVLVSGSGTNLQALLDAIAADPDGFGARVVA